VLETITTEVDKRGDDIIPKQWVYLFNIDAEIDDSGYIKGYMVMNRNGDIFEKQTTFVNNKYVFCTKINVKTDKLYIIGTGKPYIIGDTDFIGYNIISTMAYIIGNTQPFIKKLSLKAEIQLERIELKNNRVHRVHVKRYGQTKIYMNNEKTNDPVHGEDEITVFKTNRVIEIKKLKQSTYNVVKVIKVFGNEESEISETMTKLTLGLYTNAVLKTTEEALERIIAWNWKVLI